MRSNGASRSGPRVDVGREAEHDAFRSQAADQIGDIALEALLVRLDLLEQRRLAGVAERAAGARLLLEHRHRVALGDERRIGQSGRAGADHRDALAARRLRSANNGLAAGRAVDHAADARAAAHLVDAGVAGEAAPDRLAAPQLLDPLRIGDQRAAERDEIGLAACDRRFRSRRIAEPADRDHRHADLLFTSAAKSRKVASGMLIGGSTICADGSER